MAQVKSELEEFISAVRQRIIDGGRFSLQAFDKAVSDQLFVLLAGKAKEKAAKKLAKSPKFRTKSNSTDAADSQSTGV